MTNYLPISQTAYRITDIFKLILCMHINCPILFAAGHHQDSVPIQFVNKPTRSQLSCGQVNSRISQLTKMFMEKLE